MAILVLNAFFCHFITIKMLKHLVALALDSTDDNKVASASEITEKGERLFEVHQKMYHNLLFQRSAYLPKVTFQGALTQENCLNVSQ